MIVKCAEVVDGLKIVFGVIGEDVVSTSPQSLICSVGAKSNISAGIELGDGYVPLKNSLLEELESGSVAVGSVGRDMVDSYAYWIQLISDTICFATSALFSGPQSSSLLVNNLKNILFRSFQYLSFGCYSVLPLCSDLSGFHPRPSGSMGGCPLSFFYLGFF